jgi:VIT1/CCC1 family predicted Fe2+/Mn2+ transporter
VGSLRIPVLLHATVNIFAAILTVLPADTSDSARPFLLYTFLVCLLAASVTLLTGPRLSSKHVLGQGYLNNNPRE